MTATDNPLTALIARQVSETGRSPAWLSLRAGLSRDAIRNIYRHGTARDATLEKLAPHLGVPVAQLIEARDGPMPTAPPPTPKPQAERPPGRRRPMPVILRELYAAHIDPDPAAFLVHVRQPNYYRRLQDWLAHNRASRRLSIKPLPSDYGYSIASPDFEPERRGFARLQFSEEYGAFLITVGSEKLVLCRVRVGTMRTAIVESALATRSALLALETALKTGIGRPRLMPGRTGLWQAIESQKIIYFKRWNAVTEHAERFQTHPQYRAVAEDHASFRDQLHLYTRYNLPGLRKLLLTGPPGTGKTSILQALAWATHKELCVVYAPGDLAFYAASVVAKKPRPTLLIAEELDALYKPDASILTFLDGMDTPRNPQGTYLIASTNYPRRIDPRILKRPGRIDRRIRVGPINAQKHVVPIARQYLPEGVEISDKELGEALSRTTPAEMIEIINQAVRLTAASNEPLTKATLDQARAALKAELAAADAEADDEDTPEEREHLFKELGPAPDLLELDDDDAQA